MNIKEFAKKYRLNTELDPADNTTIVRGKLGQIYEYDDNQLAVMIMPESRNPRHWNNRRRFFKLLNMEICQDGDEEGSAIFDPENNIQARAAIRGAGIHIKKQLSVEARERLAQVGLRSRFKETRR